MKEMRVDGQERGERWEKGEKREREKEGAREGNSWRQRWGMVHHALNRAKERGNKGRGVKCERGGVKDGTH